MEKETNSKFIHHFMNIFCVLIQLINDTLKLVPFGLVMGPVILFFFLMAMSPVPFFMNGKSQLRQRRCCLFCYT